MTNNSARPKALIVVSSGSELPLTKPEGGCSITIGWFLVELAAVLDQYEDTHDFVLATPDGKLPTLDINGMALAMHGGANLGSDRMRGSHAERAVRRRRGAREERRAGRPP
ncbi:hypothetical protein ABZ330_36255 [Streptomyces sp. NPDC006172]|uniref:hypothetical protein n=1 Tax=Streptomyces sp. NPDC006172 TaxID=3154470 RepID=UPI0033C717F4